MTYTVQGAEVVYDDPQANSHKFWRLFILGPDEWACQFGRVGTEGQPKLFHQSPSFGWAKLDEKQRRGYEGRRDFSFDVDDTTINRVRQGADLKGFVARLPLGGHVGTRANSAPLQPSGTAEEDELREALLRLRGRLAEKMEPEPEPEPAPDSMEAKLTMALAKAAKK